MSDLSLLNKLFECYLMLCRSESIIKKDKIFKVCEEICLCQGESWVMRERHKRLVEVGSEIYLEVRLLIFARTTGMTHWLLEGASCMDQVLIISSRT